MAGPKAVRFKHNTHGGNFLTLIQAKGKQSAQEGKKPEKFNNPMRELKIQVCFTIADDPVDWHNF